MSAPTVTSPWPRRIALALLWVSIPLFLFGGTVTTLRAGMAEDGWLRPDGYFLWLYPLDMRLRDVGTFVEHHHREIGSLAGLLAIALVVVTWIWDRRRAARFLALGTLFAICVQGAIGGFRVLEANPDLAFLHGALAHGVFELIGCHALLASKAWRRAEPGAGNADLNRLTLLAALAVYLQIVAGAWLRHSGAPVALMVHLMLAAVAVVAALQASAQLSQRESEPLKNAGRNLKRLVGIQVLLGLGSAVSVYGFSGGFEGRVSAGEVVFSTLHVLFGALLLLQSVTAALWARRVAAEELRLSPSLGGVR
jgi:cytochrome c oxidase assembly protein subunit 15